MYKVAVVEDDAVLRAALNETLTGAKYQVSTPADFSLPAGEYLATVLETHPDLIVLDLNLPHQNGINLIKSLRANQNNTPVIMITCSTSEADEVLAMGFGADDYVTKPFKPQILLLRIEAILRRTYSSSESQDFRGLTIDLARGVIFSYDKQKSLTKNEMIILSRLLLHKGEIVSRTDLMTDLWNNQEYINDNALTVSVSRLRTKFQELGVENAIETRKGLGYILQ